jgi:hypothetical protein
VEGDQNLTIREKRALRRKKMKRVNTAGSVRSPKHASVSGSVRRTPVFPVEEKEKEKERGWPFAEKSDDEIWAPQDICDGGVSLL